MTQLIILFLDKMVMHTLGVLNTDFTTNQKVVIESTSATSKIIEAITSFLLTLKKP